MKRRIGVAIVGLAALCAPAHAQITFDMSRVTCADYNAMSPAASRTFSAWMSGWFNQRSSSTTINLEGFRRNVANVQRWCRSNPGQTVMAGLTAAVANARPGQPGPTTVDASQITCGQLLSTDPALQSVVVPWMSGWFMSTKNLTNVDIRYVDRNGGVIRNFCKRNRNVGLMDAIGQNWR